MYKHLPLQAVKTGGLALSRLVLGGLGLIWIARELGPSEYGKVAFVFAVVNFLAIPFYGALNNFLVRETAHVVLNREVGQICALKSFAYRMHLVAWAYTIVALVSCLTLQTSLDHRLFSVAVFLIPFICLVSMQAGLLRGQGHVVNAQSLEWFWQPALYVFFLAVAFFDERLESLEVVWAALAAYACASLLGIHRIRTMVPNFLFVPL